MDEVDLRICQLLFANSRLSQRDITAQLGIGAANTHRRIQSLVEQKVIRRFTANISRSYLGAVAAQVDGVCACQSVEGALNQLGSNGSVASVLVSAANLTSLTLILPKIEDLGPAVEHIRNVLQMQQPKVTISMKIYVGTQPLEKEFTGGRELSRIDYRIINALHYNSRKPVIDLADEIDITPKTARYRLEMMEREGSIEYGCNWDPARTAGVSFVVRIDMKPGFDRNELIGRISQRYGPKFIFTFVHCNVLDHLCGYCWTPTIAQHNDLITALKGDEAVSNARSGIIHDQWDLETWRDRLLREMATKEWQPAKGK